MSERGWDVFDSDRGLTIQRDDEAAVFADDETAIKYALMMMHVDPYAFEAILCCCLQDYERWEAFLKSQRKNKR